MLVGNDGGFDADQGRTLRALVVTCSSLSIAGCLLMLATFLLFPDLRVTSRRLLCYLSLADLLTAVFNMVGVLSSREDLEHTDAAGKPSPTTLCIVQSYVNTFSSMASFFWTVAIALYLYLSLARNNPLGAERSVPWLHIFSWIVPAFATTAALLSSVCALFTQIQKHIHTPRHHNPALIANSVAGPGL